MVVMFVLVSCVVILGLRFLSCVIGLFVNVGDVGVVVGIIGVGMGFVIGGGVGVMGIVGVGIIGVGVIGLVVGGVLGLVGVIGVMLVFLVFDIIFFCVWLWMCFWWMF